MSGLGHFITELRQRKVFRAAAVYGAVAWITIQALSIVVPELGLPSWITRAVIIAAIVGFPITLVLAWAYDLPQEGAAAARSRRVLAAGAVLLLLGSISAGWLYLNSDERLTVPRGDALVPYLDSLTAAGRHEDALRVAEIAERRGAELAPEVWWRIAETLTVLTDPPGAVVVAESFTGDSTPGARRVLGPTPLRGVRLPRGDYLLRIEHPGHETMERIASSSLARSSDGRVSTELTYELELVPQSDSPDDMVRVPGGPYALISRNVQGTMASLEPFAIDRFEVDNASYAQFVETGGYTKREYWTDLYDDVGADSAAAIRDRLRDRTGMPAPREWSGQMHPQGLERHPVTGVSWYEAAAYCRYRGARLPTFFEWERTARDGRFTRYEGVTMPWGVIRGEPVATRANFGGRGTSPVDAHPFGQSPYGAYGMAGNVKEWVSNATEGGRAVTGGSWEDPIYLFTEIGASDPLTATPSLGFRCARVMGAAGTRSAVRTGDPEQGNQPLAIATATPTYTPVDEATFRQLLGHYRYDRREVVARITTTDVQPGWTRERIVIESGSTPIIAYLYLPTSARPPYQTLVFVPASDAFGGVSVPYSTESRLGPHIRSGRAVVATVLYGMTERPRPPGSPRLEPGSVAFRDLMVQHATELRTVLDYLETRSDIDSGALAYIGISFGAGSRLVLAGTDDRFRSFVLIGAGIDERVQPTLPEASNINFAPYLRGPKLMVNGREDEEHPWLTRALPLWNLLSEPKELVLVEGAGHLPPPEARIPAINDFLDQTLGAVQR